MKKQQNGFTLLELMVSLACASIIALGVVAFLMPLRRQVVEQMSWSELAQQGRMASLVLLRLGCCARTVNIDQDHLVLALDRTCACKKGFGSNEIVCGETLSTSKDDSILRVEVFSKLTRSKDIIGEPLNGLFVKLDCLPAQEWVSGVMLRSMSMSEVFERGVKLRVLLKLHSKSGRKKLWELNYFLRLT